MCWVLLITSSFKVTTFVFCSVLVGTQWVAVSILGYQTVQIQSQGGAREQMERNGGVQEMWRLTRSTVSAICTEDVPVQESMWKFMPTPQPRGFAMTSIKLLLPCHRQLCQFLTPHPSTRMFARLSLLNLLFNHTINLLCFWIGTLSRLQLSILWTLLHQTESLGRR